MRVIRGVLYFTDELNLISQFSNWGIAPPMLSPPYAPGCSSRKLESRKCDLGIKGSLHEIIYLINLLIKLS